MTVIRMSVATVTASLAAEVSLCAVIVYNHRLGRRKWRYNRSIEPASLAQRISPAVPPTPRTANIYLFARMPGDN